LLDPRFKDMHFKNPLANSKVQEKIIKMTDVSKIMGNDICQRKNKKIHTVINNIQCDSWNLHKTIQTNRSNVKLFNNTSKGELISYLKRVILKLNESPLIKWESTKAVFPNLYNTIMLLSIC